MNYTIDMASGKSNPNEAIPPPPTAPTVNCPDEVYHMLVVWREYLHRINHAIDVVKGEADKTVGRIPSPWREYVDMFCTAIEAEYKSMQEKRERAIKEIKALEGVCFGNK